MSSPRFWIGLFDLILGTTVRAIHWGCIRQSEECGQEMATMVARYPM